MANPEVVLKRFAYTPDGTFGVLEVWDQKPGTVAPSFRCYTVERAWLNNLPNISCIPTGRYLLTPTIHNQSTPDKTDDYAAYRINGVPGRTAINMHIANHIGHIKGCVGLGIRLGFVEGHWAVTSSRAAFGAFMTAMEGAERAYITIMDEVPYEWD